MVAEMERKCDITLYELYCTFHHQKARAPESRIAVFFFRMFLHEEGGLVKPRKSSGRMRPWKLFIRSVLFCIVLTVTSFTSSAELRLPNDHEKEAMPSELYNSRELDDSLVGLSVSFFYKYATIVDSGQVDINIDIAREILNLASEFILRDTRRERKGHGSRTSAPQSKRRLS